jgi:hypothetical protein
MPLVAVPVVLLLVLAIAALVPLSLVQRYRAGTARRRARRWVATLNVVSLALSCVLCLMGAAFTTVWVRDAFAYALGGMALGAGLGWLGLAITRWEPSAGSLHYTPNRWLVLAVTLVVTLRVGYGFWRSWQAWGTSAAEGAWLVQSAVVGSLAAGAVVLGYYFIYWLGVRRRAGLQPSPAPRVRRAAGSRERGLRAPAGRG